MDVHLTLPLQHMDLQHNQPFIVFGPNSGTVAVDGVHHVDRRPRPKLTILPETWEQLGRPTIIEVTLSPSPVQTEVIA